LLNNSLGSSIRNQLKPSTLTSVTADGAAINGPCRLITVVISASASGSVVLYDNTAASGTNLFGTLAISGAGTTTVSIPDGGTVVANGVYVDVTGSITSVTLGTRAL